MGARMRVLVVSGLLALIATGGVVAPAAAVDATPVVSPAAPAFNRRLTAFYQMDPSDSTAEIPSDSSSLHVLLPEQASGFAFPRLSWVISGAAKSTVGTVALPLGTTELDL